jgi:FtsH-binding integral membrane protein
MLEPRSGAWEFEPDTVTHTGAYKEGNMADFRNSNVRVANGVQADAAIDEGLRAYMLRVYNIMAMGLGITGVAAYGTYMLASTNPAFAQLLYASPLKWVIMLAPLAMVFFLSFRIEKMSVSAAQTTFWVYAAMMGLSLSSIFIVFTGASITQTFFITASFLRRAVAVWLHDQEGSVGHGLVPVHGPVRPGHRDDRQHLPGSRARLQFAISAIGVLVFAGLTAYDTQQIKEMYYEGDGAATAGRKAIMGALRLYLDFINLFMFLLQFLGNRE